MKKLTGFAVVALCGWLLAGCATKTAERMISQTWTTNRAGDVTYEIKQTKGSFFMTWGDARQLLDKSRLSNGKTHSIGLYGYDSETTTTNIPALLKGGGELIGAGAAAFLKAQGLGNPIAP